jgi:hypothetical protein
MALATLRYNLAVVLPEHFRRIGLWPNRVFLAALHVEYWPGRVACAEKDYRGRKGRSYWSTGSSMRGTGGCARQERLGFGVCLF